ncbi:MAG TPA: DUF1385 domain-containing protein [Chitinivibrionales bacterium]|nr:DUF1385 domain-containing protein [Chitinivibrionales bacterium]
MIRSKHRISWAVKNPDGETIIERLPFVSLLKRHRFLAVPIVRGAIGVYESLKIGYAALARSAQIASGERCEIGKQVENSNRGAFLASLAIALVICLGLFMYLPMLISQVFFKDSALAFNGAAGTIRIALFLAYLASISLWKDIRRVFEYHGAEHKAIFAFEDGKELTLENMRSYSTLHPRCGTSFLLLVAMICIVLFSVIDTIVVSFAGPYPNVLARLCVHLVLLPLVAGSSYEVLRFSDRFQHFLPVKLLIMPGLWLQKITTRQPNDEQLGVASAALKASL